jgi:hypothetical protein
MDRSRYNAADSLSQGALFRLPGYRLYLPSLIVVFLKHPSQISGSNLLSALCAGRAFIIIISFMITISVRD